MRLPNGIPISLRLGESIRFAVELEEMPKVVLLFKRTEDALV
jgi:hypothetical protein